MSGWPEWLWTVPYSAHHHPNAPRADITAGANCQVYAYAVLGLFGLVVPAVRSSQLWSEHGLARTVGPEDLAPLDLLLFNADDRPCGAHVGILMAIGEVLHLCREVGMPGRGRRPSSRRGRPTRRSSGRSG